MWKDLGLTKQDWEKTPQAVRTTLLSLRHQLRLFQIRHTAYEQQLSALRQEVAQIDDLKAEINELRERLNQNSTNSSRPPSTDPSHQKRHKPERKRSKRKRGGQPGHQGFGRALISPDEVDHVIDVRPLKCRGCGRRLAGEDAAPARRQVSEIPPARVEVTEYRRHTLCCSACGVATPADWPEEMPAGSFGPRVQATVAYLTGRLGASHRDVREAMEVLHGLKVGLGSISAIERQVSEALAEPVEQARRFVQEQRAQYVDETGWKEAGHQKWLWINATRQVTVFHVLSHRNAEAARAVIDAKAKGTITSDRCGAYNWLAARRRQICWAHLMRDFQALVERGSDSAITGSALLKQARESFKLWHQLGDGLLTRKELKALMEPITERVRKLLEKGSRSSHAKTRRTCQNILNVQQSLWRYVEIEGVEPTNNCAERGLRRAVLWRRKSFGTQSAEGSRFVARILSTTASLRQQGRNVLEFLTKACAGVGSSKVRLCPAPDSS